MTNNNDFQFKNKMNDTCNLNCKLVTINGWTNEYYDLLNYISEISMILFSIEVVKIRC